MIGAAKRVRKRISTVMPGFDYEKESEKVLDALDPYFREMNEKGAPRNLGDGDFHGDKRDKTTGLPINLLTKDGEKNGKSYFKKTALDLLTRGITMEKMLDPKGIYEKGAAQLQSDPHKYFSMSMPTKKIKAFISHTWESKDFNAKTNARDRAAHAEQTTKAIMWHIKFRLMCVGNFLSHLIMAALITIFPPVGFAIGLVFMFGFPLWIVATESSFVMWFLGLNGNQFWMDKATIHQANLTERVPGKKYAGTKHVFVANIEKMSEAEKAESTSKYRVLNQAGVGLFDHFLKTSDELWVLFIPRYIERVWCIYELAYWLRLMKMDRANTRRIKMVPIMRNLVLYNGLPQHQGVVAVMSCIYCGIVTLAGVYFHKSGENVKSLGVGLEVAVIGGISFCLLVGGLVLAHFIKTDIRPARERRIQVVKNLKRFEWKNAKASNEADKMQVQDMIVTLWSKQLNKKGDISEMQEKDKSKILKSFEKDVQTDVANRVDSLLKSGEHALIFQYVLQILSVIILDGLIIGLIALDYVRPIIAPRFGFWATQNLVESYLIFGILGAAVIVINVAIYKWVERKWGR
eukprot:scaffold71471_cov27-Tisochrysis_lutea.AAC.1